MTSLELKNLDEGCGPQLIYSYSSQEGGLGLSTVPLRFLGSSTLISLVVGNEGLV